MQIKYRSTYACISIRASQKFPLSNNCYVDIGSAISVLVNIGKV